MLLISFGLAVLVTWGLILPRLPLTKTHPKWLASDPVALERYHRLNSLLGVIAGALMLIVGVVTLF